MLQYQPKPKLAVSVLEGRELSNFGLAQVGVTQNSIRKASVHNFIPILSIRPFPRLSWKLRFKVKGAAPRHSTFSK